MRAAVLMAVTVVTGMVAGLYTAAWIRSSSIEQAAFFDSTAGDNADNVPLVFAHQGGELLRPSNTMTAFTHAVELGAQVIDTDLHMTADGELVLVHDETVDRTSDGTGAVRDLTLAELRALDFGYAFITDDGRTFSYRGQGHGIVTVEELFEAFDDHRFGIEIKQTGPDAATLLCRQIHRFGYEDRVIVSSFTQPNMDVFRRACPEVATSATGSEVRTFYVLHRLGLVGLIDPEYQAFQVPESAGGILILSDGFVADARSRGIAVVPWTINGPELMDRLIALGVDGINTDRPDRLLARLADPPDGD
jgi:glycerophosphoryl diester phosphodiesterase